ncbi:MAG: DUF805 domain-containing protein [Muribaculaceae bacterium]|nr:DUF805 domain-containing protein [Muribaculaceae bacterium]
MENNVNAAQTGFNAAPVQPVNLSAKDAYTAYWKNYATFAGRTRRSGYWYPVLFNLVISAICAIIGTFTLGIPGILFSLATIVPSFAVISRRLHDIGKGFGWIFIGLIPLVGAIVLLVFMCKDSEPGTNRFGANPKGF